MLTCCSVCFAKWWCKIGHHQICNMKKSHWCRIMLSDSLTAIQRFLLINWLGLWMYVLPNYRFRQSVILCFFFLYVICLCHNWYLLWFPSCSFINIGWIFLFWDLFNTLFCLFNRKDRKCISIDLFVLCTAYNGIITFRC